MREPFPVTVAKWILIALAIAAVPFYGLWVACGALADKRGQEECSK